PAEPPPNWAKAGEINIEAPVKVPKSARNIAAGGLIATPRGGPLRVERTSCPTAASPLRVGRAIGIPHDPDAFGDRLSRVCRAAGADRSGARPARPARA